MSIDCILVVEDAEVVRMMAVMVLERAGYRVVQARDGQEGLERATLGDIDLVVTDQEMPRMDGLTLARSLRGLPGHEHIPILMITAEADSAFAQSARSAGIDKILKKPVGAATLMATVATLAGARTPRLASA